MVTFSLPGDDVAGSASNGTPRARPPLPFASRASAASPFTAGSARRLGTPQAASARRTLMTRDETPASGLTKGSIATARNIFRASTISDSPPTNSFSPSLPASTRKKVFAPAATPEPTRIQRSSIAQATPRGMAAKANSAELFAMKIPSPPSDLTGAELTRKVPKEWNSKTSIYADQYLADLCPPEFNDEQRRQFFCILDLRRLKYAADEIFCKKDWKLNIINFAKEFEKSRSIILLRYGLYEFQNVKPSREVLKRWRREHGLPEPEEEETDAATPSRPTASGAKKRKALDGEATDARGYEPSASKSKRRATTQDNDDADAPAPVSVPTPAPAPALASNKNKRKASADEGAGEQPAKMQRATPSGAKSLFEKVANKSSTPFSPTPAKPTASAVATEKTNGESSSSVFAGFQPGKAQSASSGNIFGHLSDSSAKNSGVEADAESESDSEVEADESQDAGQSDGPSTVSAPSQADSSLFAAKPASVSLFGANSTSAPSTRESTPGRSLFDRVAKDSEGQPLRAEKNGESSSASGPSDQTWNPTTTPIKFAPAAPAANAPSTSMFGNNASNSSSSVFAPKATTTANLFGAPKQDQQPANESAASSAPASASATDKDGGESDKENESQGPKQSLFDSKSSTAQPMFGGSLFGAKPAATEPAKDAEAAKPAQSLFSASKPESKPETSAASNMFGSANNKQGESAGTNSNAVMQSSTLFGAKPAETEKTSEAEATKPQAATSLFGNSSASTPTATTATAGSSGTAAAPLFGAQSNATASNLFGGGSASTPAKSLFGSATAATDSTAPKTGAATSASSQPASTPSFSFGSGGNKPTFPAASSSSFGGPQSPSGKDAPKSMFDGSPMKQDEPSPAKRAFPGSSTEASSTPQFAFGGQQTSSAPSNIFGGAASNTTPATGEDKSSAPAASSSGSFNFNFGAGGGSASNSFSNPFASANGGNDQPAAPAVSFGFGGSSAPSTGNSSPFQFGSGASGNSAAPSGGSMFGGNQACSNNNNATPAFGGAPNNAGGTPSFGFSGGSTQPSQGSGNTFGANTSGASVFGNLQPPAGGTSTTGTNSPFSLGAGGGSSLATTPAAGTPEPSTQTDANGGGENEDGEKHEQINLTEGLEGDEEIAHEVRAKVLKFVPASEDDDDKPKSKSPWSTQGVGPLRVLKHKETNAVRLLLRAEPRGHIAINRALLPDMDYKADTKYVKLTTANEKGDGLETWMIQVKTKDLATELAEALEKNKEFNKK